MKNHYAILDVLPNAPAEVIKQAYRRKAQTEHPDKGGNAEKFKAVQEAYEVLSDPERRARYDAGEDTTAAPLDTVAILSQLCIQMASEPNVIDAMRGYLKAEKRRAATTAQRANEDAERLTKTAAWIKRKDGENFLSAVLLNQAEQCRRQATATLGAEGRLDALIAALAGFEYETPVGIAQLLEGLPNPDPSWKYFTPPGPTT